MTRPVVWITPYLALPPRSGGDIRTVRLLQEVSQRAPTTLIVVGPALDEALLREATSVTAVLALPACSAPAARILAVRRRWPVAAARAWHPGAAARVSQLVEDGARLVCDRFYTAPYGVGHPHVLHLHDAEAARIASLPRPGGVIAGLSHVWSRWVLPEFERSAVNQSGAHVVAVSEADAETLGIQAHVVPNGTDLQPPRSAPREGLLLFIGALDYEPNRHALTWWSRAVWPLLPAGTPPLTVVGRSGARPLAPLDTLPGVDLLGEVADLAPVLERAQIAVLPLQHGGGTRLKVLEAMAWSLPVLATSKAVEGLGVQPGHDLCLADDPAEFALRLTSLRANLAERRRLGAAGRAAVETLGWPAVARRFFEVVEQLPGGW